MPFLAGFGLMLAVISLVVILLSCFTTLYPRVGLSNDTTFFWGVIGFAEGAAIIIFCALLTP